MHLWNDYEGKTLAGTFLIETLLFTEGRNASFATHDRAGRPAVLRLTEALNDQQQMRARYGAIQSLGQRNLVAIEDFGDVEVEGTPLIYLVMEATEENLADIVRERPLSIEETGEVALSLVSALEAMHAHGLVHGHVEPASVLAAGQVIKLRSDCVQPAPEDEEGVRARAADVFGLADVLNRCLTQQRLQDASDALALPEPYASIVRNVVRGSWGIEQVAHEVRRSVRASVPQPIETQPLRSEPVVAPDPLLAGASLPAEVRKTEVRHAGEGALAPSAADPQLALPYARGREQAGRDDEDDKLLREPRTPARLTGAMAWGVGAALLCLLLLLVWHFAGSSNKANAVEPGTAALTTAPAASVPAAAPMAPAAAPAPVVSAPTAAAASEPRGPAPLRGEVWRVVAYTYNLETQAQSKARAIAEHHAELHPQVFSRTGHAPFLVTLGGALTKQQAAAVRQQARSEGLARDVYMQNYSR